MKSFKKLIIAALALALCLGYSLGVSAQPPDTDEVMAKSKLQAAHWALVANNQEGAVKLLQEVISNPRAPQRLRAKAYLSLADISLRKTDYKNAKVAFKQVLEMSDADKEDKDLAREFLPMIEDLIQVGQ